jgi:hypothetical protein
MLLKKAGITDEQIEAHNKRFDEALSKASQEDLLLHKLSTSSSSLTDVEKVELEELRVTVSGS